MLQALDTTAARATPGSGTEAIIALVQNLKWDALDPDVKHAAKRHFLDTLGVIIAGSSGDLAGRAEAVLAKVRAAGRIPVPGRHRRADLFDAAYIAGTAGHGIELDDGYRQGSVHPGVATVPAIIGLGYEAGVSGRAALEAVVVGYETIIAIARACHPDLRQRGFHPTGACAVFGAAVATAKLRGLTRAQIADAMGIAASSSAGLFAFVNGGADIKRLHAGHASREGLQSALLAAQGVQGPPGVIESRDGFMQAFAFGRIDKARPVTLPPPFGITDCYIKPYACCRHIQPAIEALIGLANDEKIAADEVTRIDVETYRIAAEHAHTGWDDFASAQLSFPFLIGLALTRRGIKMKYFDDDSRRDPAFARIAQMLHVSAPSEIDRLYPRLRPARVTVTTPRGTFTRQADEALGSRIVPLDDAGLKAKFDELVEPVLGAARAAELRERLWEIESTGDVRPIVELAAKPRR